MKAPKSKFPPCDSAQCLECGWKGRLIYCKSEQDSEGWEYPEYTVHFCPKCGEYVDNYYMSRECVKAVIAWENLDCKKKWRQYESTRS